jgi:hypothetical protein
MSAKWNSPRKVDTRSRAVYRSYSSEPRAPATSAGVVVDLVVLGNRRKGLPSGGEIGAVELFLFGTGTFFQLLTAWALDPRAIAGHHQKTIAALVAGESLLQAAAHTGQEHVQHGQARQGLLSSVQTLARTFLLLVASDLEGPGGFEAFVFRPTGAPGHRQQQPQQRAQTPARKAFAGLVLPMHCLPNAGGRKRVQQAFHEV